LLAVLVWSLLALGATARSSTPLQSWNESASKKAVLDFVARVTTPGTPDFVPVADRVAVFDNDGTLWSEQPMYFQMAFSLDRVKALAPTHPEWKTTEPFKSVIEDDIKAALSGGERALMAIAAASHARVTTDEYSAAVAMWLATAKHPRFQRPYTDLVYQPMLDVLDYLRANGFKTYIVSGGGVEFMRVFAQRTYGIPPEQVIGSRIKMEYQVRNGTPVIARLAAVDFIDDGAGKPVAIEQIIGRRPLMAFGNSDGDFQMLEWTTAGKGPRFALLVHHTDADREWAYDRASHVGRLVRGLDEGPTRGWTIVDMKADWKVIYAFQK
jgi:phosphoglycolate phosphatase-like HAD superfamily hydrolase